MSNLSNYCAGLTLKIAAMLVSTSNAWHICLSSNPDFRVSIHLVCSRRCVPQGNRGGV